MDMPTIEGEAERVHREADSDPDDPISTHELCSRLTGSPPLVTRQPQAGRLLYGCVYVSTRVPEHRRAWVIGHELAHWIFGDDAGEDLEERCDALGAALVAPARAFRAAMRVLGHRVHGLAETFATSQALALLRIGEVTGRPVALLGSNLRLRGEWHQWPVPRETVHPVRLTDERRWGLMAR